MSIRIHTISTAIVVATVSLAILELRLVWASSNERPEKEVLAEDRQAWRSLDPGRTLYIELEAGRVIVELAPTFAPNTIKNIKSLIREKYFDGLSVIRAEDNYVVQIGDSEGGRHFRSAAAKIAPEFIAALPRSKTFTRLPDKDGYAPEVGFWSRFPAARDLQSRQSWLLHCYGAVGIARSTDPASGNGSSIYVVIGPSRILDRNATVIGRVLQGMELLSTLPRGKGARGFYEKPGQRPPVKSVRMAIDVPQSERANLEVLRTDTGRFAALVEARRNRRDAWTKVPAGYVDVCSLSVPVRAAPK